MTFLSIIVPIYNIQEYLPECIESVLNQEFKDFELILVNDGSPDDCGIICDNYASQDNRIRVIHQKNTGVSGARNAGILKASGEYTIFLDGDDFLNEDCLNTAVQVINNMPKQQIYINNAIKYYSQNTSKTDRQFETDAIIKKTSEEVVVFLLAEITGCIWGIWRHIYKTSFIKDNNLFFPVGIKRAEDADWFISALISATKIAPFSYPLTYYRVDRPGSATADFNVNGILDELKIYKKWYDYFYSCDYTDETRRKLCAKFANRIANQLGVINEANKAERKILLKEMQANKEYLANVTGAKHKVAVLICNLFGFNIGTWILGNTRKFLGNSI